LEGKTVVAYGRLPSPARLMEPSIARKLHFKFLQINYLVKKPNFYWKSSLVLWIPEIRGLLPGKNYWDLSTFCKVLY